jgi:hypothetical protein
MSELLDSFINRMTEGGVFEMLFGKLLPSLSAVACYVFLGVALTVLSRATGIGRVWQAWVPFANLYLIGHLADVYTDNCLTTEADRARPFYTPSLLRRRILGYGIGSGISGAAASVGWLLCIAGGAIAFFLLLGSWAGDEIPDTPPATGTLMAVGALVGFVAGILYLVFTVMLLVAICPALNRIFTALGAPLPALWVLLAVFYPAAAAIALFVFAERQKATLAERFAPIPPAEASPKGASEASEPTAAVCEAGPSETGDI